MLEWDLVDLGHFARPCRSTTGMTRRKSFTDDQTHFCRLSSFQHRLVSLSLLEEDPRSGEESLLQKQLAR